MTLKNEDLELLIEMEDLSHELIDKYIPKQYDEEGNIINKEWDIWTRYWNLVEKMIEKRNYKRIKTWNYIKEKRYTNPEYAGHKKKRR